MKQFLIIAAILLFLVSLSMGDHCSDILKLDCEKYCHDTCTKASGDKVVCNLVKSICDNIGCCHHEGDTDN
uniref:Uncharacterized protein n=2 Tax=Meloidogyne TaxID=189290 RepID=A0A914NAU2_MELIC|nr:unnamed protein product [Meloidogyne enterolobii]